MFTLIFFRAAAERAVKTAAQSAVLVLGAGAVGAFDVDWLNVASFAAGGAVLSFLTSYGSGLVGDATPSLGTAEVLEPAPDGQLVGTDDEGIDNGHVAPPEV